MSRGSQFCLSASQQSVVDGMELLYLLWVFFGFKFSELITSKLFLRGKTASRPQHIHLSSHSFKTNPTMLLKKSLKRQPKRSALSRDFRQGLVQSLQPLQQHHPLLFQQSLDSQFALNASPTAVAARPSPLFTNANPLLYAAAVTPSVSFLKLLLAFTAGGLFFSTALAAVGACYAVGRENLWRILEIVGIIVKNVWTTFTLGLGAAKLALLGEETTGEPDAKKSSWKWRDAWTVLKLQLVETRRTAAEGVQALRQEATIYKAAVGPAGLIPLQYIIDQLMPLSLAGILEESLKDSLSSMKPTSTINRVKLSSFTAGTKAPVLEAARVYDVENAIAFDYDVHWDSQIEATMNVYTAGGLARLPVTIKKLKFDGVVRVILSPLTKTPPGFGAILLSLPSAPQIGLDVRFAGGEVTKLPWLRTELMSGIQKGIADELLWPQRVVIPSLENGRPILSARALKDLETSDPLLVAEKALEEKPMLRESRENIKPASLRKRMKIMLIGEEDGPPGPISQFNDTTAMEETVMTTMPNTIRPTDEHHLSRIQRGIVLTRLEALLFKNPPDKD
jgi:hypothetical protein